MTIADFAGSSPGFYRKTAVEQLLALAWFVEARQQRAYFDGAYIRQCFKEAGIEPPDMSVYLPRLAAKRPPQLIKEKGGYRLAGAVRRALDVRLGGDPTTSAVAKALTDLPTQIPDLAEREFLTEALNCYRVRAFRATIIMAWNLAYDHLVRWVFSDPIRIQSLNAGIASKYPKKTLVVARHEDADTLKESEFIEAARTANLLDKNTTQILKDKLGRRNMAAHPSRVTITQHQADDMITDLVANVILKLC
ncbi:MAG: hypothetical protein E5X48_23695 [Mesorhizobium sp.]|uniref:hypothetical protein n=1 Tax=Mesorhizobium sp. TaxID=1871066 RepID=UPI001229F99E|nr:hypothetical protein [Mesorhizobium sp.]TIQ33343.1 MAG: hypothetical protein E5X48_23695 [Mesorhizobium sp.]